VFPLLLEIFFYLGFPKEKEGEEGVDHAEGDGEDGDDFGDVSDRVFHARREARAVEVDGEIFVHVGEDEEEGEDDHDQLKADGGEGVDFVFLEGVCFEFDEGEASDDEKDRKDEA